MLSITWSHVFSSHGYLQRARGPDGPAMSSCSQQNMSNFGLEQRSATIRQSVGYSCIQLEWFSLTHSWRCSTSHEWLWIDLWRGSCSMNVPLFLQALNRGQIWFRNIISISIFITSEICAFISHSLPIQTLKQNPEHTLRGKKNVLWMEHCARNREDKACSLPSVCFLLLLFFIVLSYVYLYWQLIGIHNCSWCS